MDRLKRRLRACCVLEILLSSVLTISQIGLYIYIYIFAYVRVLLDYEQSLFFLGPLSKTPGTRK